MDRRHSPLPLSSHERATLSHKIAERKRWLYLLASFVALPSIYFSWRFYSDTEVFVRYVYPFLMAETVLWIGALLWRRIPLAYIEYFVLTTLALLFLANYSYYLFYEDILASWKEIGTIGGGMLVIFILGYIILEHQLALRLSMLYLALTVVIGLWKFLPTPTEAIIDWIRIETRLLIISLFTFVLAKVKDDLAASQKQASYWEWQANIDHLTQLPNRRMISAIIEETLETKCSFAVLLIDLDDFKCFNDTFGHDVGDVLLSRLAFTLRSNLRTTDHAARWGGEEFLVLIKDTTQEQALQLAERLRSEAEKIEFDEKCLSISIGGTFSKPQGDNLASLIKRADTALYTAKSQGRNCVCWE